MKIQLYFFALFCCSFTFFPLPEQSKYPQKMILNIAVADLRAQPETNHVTTKLPTSDLTNPLQITQLLLGEHMVAHEEFIDKHTIKWLKISALQQERFDDFLNWHGYPGWIQAHQAIHVDDFPSYTITIKTMMADIFDEEDNVIDTLSIGTRLQGLQITDSLWQITLPNNQIAYIHHDDIYEITDHVYESEQQIRGNVIETALKFLGSFYSWGGRSAQYQNFISSVDCSALINLSFHAHGLQIPRMSHEQFLESEKIEFAKDLQPGDLIFFSSATKHINRMNHVMMYIGNEQILEATFADDHVVRIISFKDRMNQDRILMQSGDRIQDEQDEYQVYFGTFLYNKAYIQNLRNEELKQTYSDDFYHASSKVCNKGMQTFMSSYK